MSTQGLLLIGLAVLAVVLLGVVKVAVVDPLAADFALIAAPEMLMRPWISVPSIVKKRLVGFAIGEKYVPSGSTRA